MEKSYRDLFEKLSQQSSANPALEALLLSVGSVDDISPLRVPALIAMKREPVPPLNLIYRYEDGQLSLLARNLRRKNQNYPPALCAKIDAPSWLFDPELEFPGRDGNERADYVTLVRRSFGYMETRVSNYFQIAHDSRLEEVPAPAHLKITTTEEQR